MENLIKILEGCLKNNQRCQKYLYERYFGYCLKTVYRYIYHYDKAVDIVNDGYVKVFRNFHRFQFNPSENAEGIFLGWIRSIMIHTAIDQLRKNNFLTEIGGIDEKHWLEDDNSQSSDRIILYKELITQIKKLPPSYRAVFNLFIIDGFSHQEISKILGISVGTSKSNLSRAREILQKYVKKTNEVVELACRV